MLRDGLNYLEMAIQDSETDEVISVEGASSLAISVGQGPLVSEECLNG